jgi:serine/threonine protein kinase
MTNGPVPDLDRSRLQPLRRVGDGGQGIVYFTDAVKINKTWAVAYKEYLPDTDFDPEILHRMVAFVPGLDRDTGLWLCEAAAWPAGLIGDQGRVSGFLMRRIPQRFRQPWGDGGTEVPAAMQYLLNPQPYLDRKGIVIDDRTRLLLLVDVADKLARLHSIGVVVGDLSPNNLLVDLAATPGCFFIDCDAMRFSGQDVLPQVETPEWQVARPGRREPIATRASDAYKFGLLAVRLFAQDQMGRDESALAAVSSQLGALALRSLGADSTQRPAPEDWLPALRTAVRSTTAYAGVGTAHIGALPPRRASTRPTAPPPTVTLPPARSGMSPRVLTGLTVLLVVAVLIAILLLRD